MHRFESLISKSLIMVANGRRYRRCPRLCHISRIVHRDDIFRHELLHVLDYAVILEKVTFALTLMHKLLNSLDRRLPLFHPSLRLLPHIDLFDHAGPRLDGHGDHFKRYVAIDARHNVFHNLLLRLFFLVHFLELVHRVQDEVILVLLAQGLEGLHSWHRAVHSDHIELLQRLKIRRLRDKSRMRMVVPRLPPLILVIHLLKLGTRLEGFRLDKGVRASPVTL